MSRLRHRIPSLLRHAGFVLLGLMVLAILATEARRRARVDTLLEEREQLLEVRQKTLRLERELLLARNDTAEITLAGRHSLQQQLIDRLAQVQGALGLVLDDLERLFAGSLDFEILEEAITRYRSSVEAELGLMAQIGEPGGTGLLSDLRLAEVRLLDVAGSEFETQLLRMQVEQREYTASLRTSEALALLGEVDTLRDRLRAEDHRQDRRAVLDSLDRYRELVEGVMAANLELTLLRGETGVRFDRLPAMFRIVEERLDRQLESSGAQLDRERRLAGWLAAALLATLLLSLLLRSHSERARARRMADRVRRLALGMRAFASGTHESRLDLPVGGDLGRVTTSFRAMARQLRAQIDTIEEERRRAEDAARAKSEFLALVSHELRTPLNGILGMAELLAPSLDQPQHHLLEVIQRSGSTLLSVVNDLLDFSRLEAGKLDLEVRPFDLLEMVEDLAEIHAPSAHDRGLELVLRAPGEDLPRLEADPLRLGQILTNLIGNALKFTEQGHVEVTIEPFELLDDDQVHLRMAVRDTGPGVPEHLRSHIFGAFAQGEEILRRKHGGTGLGLSIVQELLALMGGSIELADVDPSDTEGGAHFVFDARVGLAKTLPTAVADGGSRSLHGGDSKPLKGRRLLLVDAHAPSLASLEAQLVALGAECRAFVGAGEALSELGSASTRPTYEIALLGHPAAGDDPDLGELSERLAALGIRCLDLLPTSRWQGAGAALTRPPRRSALLAALADRADGTPETEGPESQPQANLSGRILLVEDNPVNREVFTLMVRQTGCQVEVAENGMQALELLASTTFDLILMDCYMPEMDGYETTRHIRQSTGPLAEIPIIALTASAFEANRQRCLDAGMDEVLAKPATQKSLSQCLAQWLDGASRAAARHRPAV